MNSSFSFSGATGASTWPNAIVEPSPLAHHSLPWKPLPENSAAKRTGASLPDAPLGSSLQASDSSHGSAMVTPRPFSMVRRERRAESGSRMGDSVHPGLGRDYFTT